VISARELTAHVLGRIERHDPALRLFVTVAGEQALAEAVRADERLARGEPTGPLHGVPLVVKDAFATAGLRTTSGWTKLASYIPEEDAVAVARLKAAGAIVVGKTNMPELAGDWQSYNDLAGTSRNPWDPSRTPGGSSGGTAGALAAGLGFLGLGGDLSGSIRIPASFCGVYGHRPTVDLVPHRGHIPPPPGVPPGPSELSVTGPMARSAEDLRIALEVMAGPDALRPSRWALPPPRQERLRDYHLGYVLDDPFCPLDPPVREVLASAVEALRAAGARLTEGWPAGFDPEEQHQLYAWLLAAFLSQTLPEARFQGMRRAPSADPWVQGTTALHRDWLRESSRRLAARARWQDHFRVQDAFLMPAAFVAAFPHDHRPDLAARRLGDRPYTDVARWSFVSTLTGCPATAAPAGRTGDGLPVGFQILGPFFEDATPIDVAARMAEVVGGFVAPPGLGRPSGPAQP
jgi:amidase